MAPTSKASVPPGRNSTKTFICSDDTDTDLEGGHGGFAHEGGQVRAAVAAGAGAEPNGAQVDVGGQGSCARERLQNRNAALRRRQRHIKQLVQAARPAKTISHYLSISSAQNNGGSISTAAGKSRSSGFPGQARVHDQSFQCQTLQAEALLLQVPRHHEQCRLMLGMLMLSPGAVYIAQVSV